MCVSRSSSFIPGSAAAFRRPAAVQGGACRARQPGPQAKVWLTWMQGGSLPLLLGQGVTFHSEAWGLPTPPDTGSGPGGQGRRDTQPLLSLTLPQSPENPIPLLEGCSLLLPSTKSPETRNQPLGSSPAQKRRTQQSCYLGQARPGAWSNSPGSFSPFPAATQRA